ncbi:MAG: hypothetical protein AABX30_03080 [Nanoarchaeota archaeon]
MVSKKAQVWVETVIYTLIALALIGTVLAFVKPKIEEIQDKLTIDQTLEMMGDIDAKILLLAQGSLGNQRLLELQIKKGELIVDPPKNSLIFTLENSRYAYSEIGKQKDIGNVLVETNQIGKYYKIDLTNNYSRYNVTYENENQIKKLTKSPTIYKLTVSNDGKAYCITGCGGSPLCLNPADSQCTGCKADCKTKLNFKLVN